jgi:hypothetical protein
VAGRQELVAGAATHLTSAKFRHDPDIAFAERARGRWP